MTIKNCDNNMRVIICEDYEEMSVQAADLIEHQMTNKHNSVLGLATGSTPIGTYKILTERNRAGAIDFSDVTTINLDEYYPIKPTNPQSYRYFMNEQLFSKVNININRTFVPNGSATDPDAECKAYEERIDSFGGTDIQLLGIGVNGHIGFNEPDSSLCAFTHLTDLTPSTIEVNSRFFESEDDVPRKAITMGIGSIFKAKQIILLASGASKAKAVAKVLEGGIDTSCPATLLNLHPNVVLICDKAAYSSVRLGVDIGGTNTKFAVVDGDKAVFKCSIPTDCSSDTALIDGIANKISEIVKDYAVSTVGVGTPGIISNGKVTSVNLPFKNTHLGQLLSSKIHLPVTVDNDANCASYGEYLFGNCKKYKNMVMLTLGTGIGGGVIINGEMASKSGIPGEFGHMVVQSNGGIPCNCGKSGCLEKYASVRSLIENAKVAIEKAPDSVLAKLASENGLDGECVFDAYTLGDENAVAIIDQFIHYLAIGIKNVQSIFAPDAIVLAGGITQSKGEQIISLLSKQLDGINVIVSSLFNDAGALGAAML